MVATTTSVKLAEEYTDEQLDNFLMAQRDLDAWTDDWLEAGLLPEDLILMLQQTAFDLGKE